MLDPDRAARQDVLASDEAPRLRVVVRRADDATPIVGHALILEGYDVAARLADVTDAAGEARFAPIEPGRYAVHGTSHWADVAAHGETFVELELSPWFEIQGRVVDAALRPVPGAEVWTTGMHLSFEGAIRRAVSGADGRFGWTSYGPVECLFAKADGYAPSPVYDISKEVVGEEGREVTLSLRRADVTEVAGVVVSAAGGTPIEGALVTLRPAAPAPVEGVEDPGSFLRHVRRAPRQRTRTDAAGRFGFRDVTSGEASLQIRAEGYGVLDTTVALEAPRAGALRFELGEPLGLTGRVVDDDGEPIAGALVQASFVADAFRQIARTGGDGRYALAPLPGRRLRVTASAEGHRSRTDDVVVPEDARTGAHDFVLEREDVLRGILLDASGGALAGWHVTALPRGGQQATTDARGLFELPLTEPPELVACAPARAVNEPMGPNRPVFREPRPRPDGRYVWRARAEDDPAATITGRLAFTPPLENPRVVLWLNAPALCLMRRIPLRLQPGVDAEPFESGPWPGGEYELVLMPGEGEDRIPDHPLGTVTLTNGQRLDLGTVEVAAAVPLEVDVTRPDGVSARGIHFELLRQPEGVGVPAGLDLDGLFHSVPLAPGDYVVRISGRGFAPVRRELTLRAGEAQRLGIELPAARDLRITCDWQKDARPRGRLHVLAHDFDTGALRFRSGVWAHELLNHGARIGLPDGRYRLALSSGGESVPVFFTPGGDEAAHFVMR